MATRNLEFDQEFAALEAKLEELKDLSARSAIGMQGEIEQLKAALLKRKQERYRHLTAWEEILVTRHPSRPQTRAYIDALCGEWQELHGDRLFGDDPAMVAGLAWFEGFPVTVLGHQKGRDTAENIRQNFGMVRPEGYRKARRMLTQAARFHRPVLTFINTPGADPGVGAEERGQAWAIAELLAMLSSLPVPVIAVVTGEGGSGGALALAVADHLIMLEHAVFSVASPEACASILWKDAGLVEKAAASLRLTSRDLASLGIVDTIIPEPPGGAQADLSAVIDPLRRAIMSSLAELTALTPADLVRRRRERLDRRWGQA